MKNKKVFVLVLAITMAVSSFIGCGKTESTGERDKTSKIDRETLTEDVSEEVNENEQVEISQEDYVYYALLRAMQLTPEVFWEGTLDGLNIPEYNEFAILDIDKDNTNELLIKHEILVSDSAATVISIYKNDIKIESDLQPDTFEEKYGRNLKKYATKKKTYNLPWNTITSPNINQAFSTDIDNDNIADLINNESYISTYIGLYGVLFNENDSLYDFINAMSLFNVGDNTEIVQELLPSARLIGEDDLYTTYSIPKTDFQNLINESFDGQYTLSSLFRYSTAEEMRDGNIMIDFDWLCGDGYPFENYVLSTQTKGNTIVVNGITVEFYPGCYAAGYQFTITLEQNKKSTLNGYKILDLQYPQLFNFNYYVNSIPEDTYTDSDNYFEDDYAENNSYPIDDEISALTSANDYNSVVTEASVRSALGVPPEATAVVEYQGEPSYKESFDSWRICVSINGTGAYEGYYAGAFFDIYTGEIMDNIFTWSN